MDSFYSEKAGFDPSRHDSVLPLSRSMRSMHHHDLGDHSSSCASLSSELDGKLRNPQQRRRVPVACRRCRKRKIKCSGDAGDGQGCSNCRSAGDNDCQFFRVSSMAAHDRTVVSARALGKAKGWQPYPHVGVAVSPSTQLRMLTAHSQMKMGSHQGQGQVAAFHRAQDFDLKTSDAHIFQRSGSANAIHYEDEPAINYAQTSTYMLPNGAPGDMMDYEASTWSPKAWDSMFGTGRASGNIYPDPETNPSLNQSQFAYMLPSQSHTISESPHSSNAGINSIPSSDGPGPDRTLPTPTSRAQQGTSSSPSFLPTEGNSNLPWLSSDYKEAFWNPRMAACTDQRSSSAHTVPSNAPLANSPNISNKNVNIDINNTAPELLFTYLPMPTISEDTSMSVPSSSAVLAGPSTSTSSSANSTYSVLDALGTTTQEYPSITSTTRINQHSSRSHRNQGLRALASECTPDTYGYSSNERSRARGSGSDPETRTLVSGLPYTRVQHRDPPGAGFSFNLLSDALPEYHRAVVESVHHPSVEPLGNQGAY